MFSMSILVVLVIFPFYVNADDPFLLMYENHISLIKESLANQQISERCLSQLKIYYNALNSRDLWAQQMFDAHGKVRSGYLTGNMYDLGNFDECLNIATQDTKGKYCLGTLKLPSNSIIRGQMKRSYLPYDGSHAAICVPDRCTADDVARIHHSQTFEEKFCYSRESQSGLSSGGIAAVAVMGFFLLLATLSTCYSLYLYYNNYKPGRDITVAFSYFINGRKLITTTTSSDQLLCLNGVKALSMMWIVMLHEYIGGFMGPIANTAKTREFVLRAGTIFTMGVDTFFVIGGLVTVYSFLKSVDRGVKFNIFSYYLHRYVRLTPALALIVLVHATLLKNFGEGPLWNAFDDHLVEPCRKHFWAALLYIQNYVHDDQPCMPQSWYLSVDMQLFILSPIVLIPLKRKPKLTLVGLVILSVAGVVVPFFVAFYKELHAFSFVQDLDNLPKYRNLYYYQTYARFGPYVMGMILGYFIYKIKTEAVTIKLKPIIVLFLWATCLAGGLACVYAGYNTMVSEYNKWSNSLYIGFHRPAWSLAVGGIMFLCVSGHGGPVNVFLSAPIFQFLSKISYTLYLVHYELILLRVCAYKTEYRLEYFSIFFNFWGDFIFSMALSVVLYLTFESPMSTVEKLLLGKESRVVTTISKQNA